MRVAPRVAGAWPSDIRLGVNAPARFPRTARLLTPRDFSALRSGSRRLGGTCFSALIKPGSATTARLGLAVSRRISRLAVQRNRIKRVARESFRHACSRFAPQDILLIANPAAASTDNAGLRAELERLWLRVATLNAQATTGTMRG